MEHHTSNSVRTLLVFAVLTPSVGAFGVSSCSHGHRIASASISPLSTVRSLRLMAKKDENENSKGMEDAFRQLEKLKSLDDEKIPLPEWKKQQDDAFAKAIQGLDLKDIVEQPPEPSVESEAELYKNMASELSSKKETDLIDDVKSDLGISPTSSIPQFDPTQRDTDQFMETALDQALEEAEQKANMQIKKESLLDNKEIMKEIEKIFEKANEELLDGLEEMREEQVGRTMLESVQQVASCEGLILFTMPFFLMLWVFRCNWPRIVRQKMLNSHRNVWMTSKSGWIRRKRT